MTHNPHTDTSATMPPLLFRLRLVGAAFLAAGLVLAGFAFLYGGVLADDGLDSAVAMYEDQGVTLSYNEDGELIDRGTTAGAEAIMALLTETWAYPVDKDNFDARDPLVNTRDELMYQYAVIVYHVWHGTTDVTLTEADVPISYRGETYTEPGTYEIQVGAYYAQLDRNHPIEGQLRAAWSPLALSLSSYLVAGHANQAAGELAWSVSMGIGAIGLLFAAAGGGLLWIGWAPMQSGSTAPDGSSMHANRADARRPGALVEHHASPPRHRNPGDDQYHV